MRSKATQGSLVMAFTGLALAILLVGHGAAQSINGHGRQITNNTPPFVQKAQNIASEDSSKLIEVTASTQAIGTANSLGDLPARGVGVDTAFDFANSFVVAEDQLPTGFPGIPW